MTEETKSKRNQMEVNSFEMRVEELVFAEYFSIPMRTKANSLRSLAKDAERRHT